MKTVNDLSYLELIQSFIISTNMLMYFQEPPHGDQNAQIHSEVKTGQVATDKPLEDITRIRPVVIPSMSPEPGQIILCEERELKCMPSSKLMF